MSDKIPIQVIKETIRINTQIGMYGFSLLQENAAMEMIKNHPDYHPNNLPHICAEVCDYMENLMKERET